MLAGPLHLLPLSASLLWEVNFLPLLTRRREAKTQMAPDLFYFCFVTLKERESCPFPETQGRRLSRHGWVAHSWASLCGQRNGILNLTESDSNGQEEAAGVGCPTATTWSGVGEQDFPRRLYRFLPGWQNLVGATLHSRKKYSYKDCVVTWQIWSNARRRRQNTVLKLCWHLWKIKKQKTFDCCGRTYQHI